MLHVVHRAIGKMTLKLRISRKEKAAKIIRSFLAMTTNPHYVPPKLFSENDAVVDSTGWAIRSSDVFVEGKQKQQRKNILLIMRNFKSAVLSIQRAWKRYLQKREAIVTLLQLQWDQLVAGFARSMLQIKMALSNGSVALHAITPKDGFLAKPN